MVEPLHLPEGTVQRLKKKLIFFYTGIGRSSGRVLKEQNDMIGEKIDHLNKLRALAVRAKADLEHDRIESFGAMLDESWNMKRTFASGISNDTIDNYYKAALKAGASGGKILGAGGGGFFMFYCEEDKQAVVRKALAPMREVKFYFPVEGSKIIFSDNKSR